MRKGISVALAAVVALSAVMSCSAGVGAGSSPTPTNSANTSYVNTTGDSDFTDDSKNTTTLKKVLEIKDTAGIPAVSFNFTTTAGAAVPATYNNSTGEIKTLAVLAGVHPESIVYREVPLNDTEDAFNIAGTLYKPAQTTTANSSSVTLTYIAQAKETGEKTTHTKSDDSTDNNVADDNVLINDNVDEEKYYAIKELQLDFSACKFTEPGIYRYIITEETTAASGVTYDTKNIRTLDVYVNHAGNDTKNKLEINGYVMYVGAQTTGPMAVSGTNTQNDIALEDGVDDNNSEGNYIGKLPDGSTPTVKYGVANGYEVIDGTTSKAALKSEGFINKYTTYDITFKKQVTGNQGSKDKYFKFTITCPNLSAAEENSVYTLTTDDNSDKKSNQVKAITGTATDTPNTATVYTIGDITATGSAGYGNNPTYTVSGTNTITAVTGAQLKAGYSFYLQDGQQITIQGFGENTSYTITEYNEDYDPALEMKTDDTDPTKYDNITGTNTVINTSVLAKTNADTATRTAAYTDDALKADAFATFTNTRNGTIPTGVILSVAAPAGIGIVVVGAIIYLVAKRRKDDDEDE